MESLWQCSRGCQEGLLIRSGVVTGTLGSIWPADEQVVLAAALESVSAREGAGVVTTRGDVHYVVTEYGVAYLHGKSVKERAMALIGIAHPDFRAELLHEAKKRRIDVWWRGRKNGELMLLLAHLLTLNDAWRQRPVRLLRVIENEEGDLEWHARIGGQEVVETKEPLTSWWRRFKAWYMKIVPESQL